MIGPVIVGSPIISKILLVGQAPGIKEGEFKKPFAWTAGKTLFKWFSSIGLSEEEFRSYVYMAAVCRCFPGKNAKGGDRVPSEQEIQNCSRWLKKEATLLQPELILPVGKLAISQFISFNTLKEVVGKSYKIDYHSLEADLIPLPHPSGASTWHRMEPGKTLLGKALRLVSKHSSWKELTRI
ncbi:MAG: uracil-DNA glycosylase family protein [Pseudomonadota bacterium]